MYRNARLDSSFQYVAIRHHRHHNTYLEPQPRPNNMTTLLFLFSASWLLLTFCSAILSGIKSPHFQSRRITVQTVGFPILLSSFENSVQQPSRPFHPLRIVGVCGPIGSGKSYACSLLVSHLNCTHHIDADSLAHGLYDAAKYPNNRHLIQQIQREFGPQVLHEQDGTINRQALGDIVFRDSSAMSRLEQIVWPHLKQRLIDRLQEIRHSLHNISQPIVVVEAAVLIDTNWDDDGLFDAIWAIDASTDTLGKRLVDKRGMRHTDALQRIAAQRGRRGIGNLIDELERGVVTAKIVNDLDCNTTYSRGTPLGSTQRQDILLERLRRALLDPSCWKPGRFPSAL